MTARYCVLLGRQEGQADWAVGGHKSTAGMSAIFERGAVSVFADPAVDYTLLSDGRGVVLGTIFARKTDAFMGVQALANLPHDQDRACWMIEHIWGRYLAILVADDGGDVEILRDPIGLFGCYSASRSGTTAFASDARLLRTIGLIGGRIDWPNLAFPLAYPDYRDAQTGLVGVTEPVPGEVIRWHDDQTSSRTIWSPTHFCRESIADGFEAAAVAVRDTIDTVVSAWAGSSAKLLLSLSGGLDSSIIAMSMPEPAARLAAFNLRSGSGRGDERDHARLVAQTIGIPLELFDISRSSVDIRKSRAADLPRASARSFTQPVDDLAQQLADAVGADAHINGGGGDNVFAYLHSANPAADRLRVEGPGPGFLKTVLDLAELTACTPLHIARRAIGKAWFKPQSFTWPHVPDLLTREYLAGRPAPRHPWLAEERQLRPGQRQHICAILRAAYLTAFLNIADTRPTFYPLLSQPLVELCLGIPTWLCCRSGRDRTVARAAFADRLPPAILARRSKGAFEGLIGTIYERHRTLIREIILDGGLVRNGIVVRDAAERALASPFANGENSGRILQCVDVEAWAAGWDD